MTDLLLAIAVFLLAHIVPPLPYVRRRLILQMGRGGYIGMYSLVSIAALVWVGTAYRAAPHIAVWDWTPQLNWGPILIMPVACMLLVGGLIEANPLTMAPRHKGFDPAKPGLAALVRHPLPWAFVLWAGAHMIPNGDAASLVMFGLFAVLALGGAHGLDIKRRRVLGADEWHRLAAGTSTWPGQALLQKRGRPHLGLRAVMVMAGGGGLLYTVFMLGHEWLVGVPPLVSAG